jgi:hypothetical protein
MNLSLVLIILAYVIFALVLGYALCAAGAKPIPEPPGLAHVVKWQQYNEERRGTYEFRSKTRYKAVADRLFAMGLNDLHTLVDVGAGSCQFGLYLSERGWRGSYLPVDAVIDGADLETWTAFPADFYVCIETLEHVKAWNRLLVDMELHARIGVVLTTPNSESVDVLGCDPTHVSVIYPWLLLDYGQERHSWFGTHNDTLLAWRQHAA